MKYYALVFGPPWDICEKESDIFTSIELALADSQKMFIDEYYPGCVLIKNNTLPIDPTCYKIFKNDQEKDRDRRRCYIFTFTVKE